MQDPTREVYQRFQGVMDAGCGSLELRTEN